MSTEYAKAEEIMGQLFVNVTVPVLYTDDTEDEVKDAMIEGLSEDLYDANDDMAFIEDDEATSIEIQMGTSDMDTIKRFFTELNEVMEGYVQFNNNR